MVFIRLIVFLSGVVIPVAFSLLRLLPFPPRLRSKFYAYVIDVPVFGKRHQQPILKGLMYNPTRGQAIFILYLIAINLTAVFVGYHRYSPNLIRPDRSRELVRGIGNRAGTIALANIPLVILFAGRNNMLLWLTNWSHSTFLLLHRWTAVICTVEACLHSAMRLQIVVSDGTHSTKSHVDYWRWGVIATLSFCILLPASVLPFRRSAYEAFLIGHIILVLLALVGAWHHIAYIFKGKEGFDIWLYIAIAVWGFDRLLRLVRLSKHGIKKAYVSIVDDEYLRVDVPGVDCSGYCYAYFPTLSWRIWENHPFSTFRLNHSNAMTATHKGSASDSETKETVVNLSAKEPDRKSVV